MDESGPNGTECRRKVASGKKGEAAIGSLANTRRLQFECARMLYEVLLVLVIFNDSETTVYKEKDRSRTRNVQTENLRGFVGY